MRAATFIDKVLTQIKFRPQSTDIATRERILESGNDEVRTLARKVAQEGYGYHRNDLSLLKATAVQIQRNKWAYRIPIWVDKVYEVRRLKPDGEPEGHRIEPANPRNRIKLGYHLQNRTTLILDGWTEAQDLRISVVKVPADVVEDALTIPEAHADADKVYVDGLADRTPGYYVNAIFEFAMSSALNIDMTGSILQPDAADWVLSPTDFARLQLTNYADFPTAPATTDLLHMHFELGDQHMRYLTLLVARKELQSQGNADGLAAIQPELGVQERDFYDSLERQQSDPTFIRSSSERVNWRVSNRDYENLYGVY